ncbi:MAG: tetratricopeptide repeat protein [Gammaproteobacteria bacterium]|nr:tetratricopeptide repeat protein [Gammaproteobacteria bacterium]
MPSDLPEYDLLRLDDEMQAFVAAAVPRSGSNAMRLESLLRAMGESGLTAVDYDAQMTRTASELFHARDGNCLAYTNLFVALAREAGLRVSYQQVDVPPTWSMDGDLLLISQHVNARVHDVVRQRSRREDRVIDFNAPQFSGHFRQRTVSDNVVEALFYNNLGVAKLQQGDQRAAFLHFRKALDADADAAAAWTNLGVLYTRVGASDLAESAFHRALRGEPGNEPAMSNLARLYRTRGEDALADAYEERLERHRQRNPYYHYLLAERALRDGRVDRALDAVDKAIRMREEEHQFHFLRARILAKNGRMQAAVSSLERARDHAGIAAARDQYARKLGDLE